MARPHSWLPISLIALFLMQIFNGQLFVPRFYGITIKCKGKPGNMLVAERNPMERRIKSTDELQIETAKFAERRYCRCAATHSFFLLLAPFSTFLTIFWRQIKRCYQKGTTKKCLRAREKQRVNLLSRFILPSTRGEQFPSHCSYLLQRISRASFSVMLINIDH